MSTPRPHFEELDWLDYAQERLAQPAHAALHDHLGGCTECQDRVAAMRRLIGALPTLDAHLTAVNAPEDQGVVERAAQTARSTASALASAAEAFATAPPPPGAFPNLAAEHVLAALHAARDAFLDHPDHGTELVAWAAAAAALLVDRNALPWPGLEGVVRSYRAYVRFRLGETALALQELDGARPYLALPLPRRDLEVGFWSYVRAACLHNLSRFPEALAAIQEAEDVYAAFHEDQRLVRSRALHAFILCDAGFPAAARDIHQALLTNPTAAAEPSLHAQIYLNYAANLIQLGALSEARAAYATTTRLLRAAGQDHLLFKVRTGLADIAHREGRMADALAINLELRPEYRRQHLTWDEVRRELWIVRELLALDRFADARTTCRALAERAVELSLPIEARRALDYLADAQQELAGATVASVQDDLERISRGEHTRWSAA